METIWIARAVAVLFLLGITAGLTYPLWRGVLDPTFYD